MCVRKVLCEQAFLNVHMIVCVCESAVLYGCLREDSFMSAGFSPYSRFSKHSYVFLYVLMYEWVCVCAVRGMLMNMCVYVCVCVCVQGERGREGWNSFIYNCKSAQVHYEALLVSAQVRHETVLVTVQVRYEAV